MLVSMRMGLSSVSDRMICTRPFSKAMQRAGWVASCAGFVAGGARRSGWADWSCCCAASGGTGIPLVCFCGVPVLPWFGGVLVLHWLACCSPILHWFACCVQSCLGWLAVFSPAWVGLLCSVLPGLACCVQSCLGWLAVFSPAWVGLLCSVLPGLACCVQSCLGLLVGHQSWLLCSSPAWVCLWDTSPGCCLPVLPGFACGPASCAALLVVFQFCLGLPAVLFRALLCLLCSSPVLLGLRRCRPTLL